MVLPSVSAIDKGELLLRSPDGRYEIRLANPSTFPAEALVHPVDARSPTHSAPSPTILQRFSHSPLLPQTFTESLNTGDALTAPFPYSSTSSSSPAPTIKTKVANSYVIYVRSPTYPIHSPHLLPLHRQLLTNAYRRCLEEAFEVGAKSIAFPCLGAGTGWRRGEASLIGMNCVRRWFGHKILGAVRRKRISGPVVFLAESVGGQGERWCFAYHASGVWHGPDDSENEVSTRSNEGDRRLESNLLEEKLATERQRKRNRPKKGVEMNKKCGKGVGKRELKNLLDSQLKWMKPMTGKRQRCPPKRYGK